MSTRHRRTEHLDLSDLRLLDPAVGRSDRATSPAAQQLLGRIVETPRTVDSGAASHGNTTAAGAHAGQQPPWPARVGRKPWVRAGAAAVAVAVGVVTLPVVWGGSGAAFASWTPVPAGVAPAEADELQADCLASGRGVVQSGVTAAMSERRGGFTFTLVATDEAIGTCMVLDPALTEAEQGASSWGPISDLPLPPIDGTSVLWGDTFVTAEGEEYTSAIGRAGADVVAVDITSSDQPNVQARVGQGYFIAWWPGGPDDEITVTTTLSDGTRSARTLKTGQT